MAASMPKNWNDFAAVSPQAILRVKMPDASRDFMWASFLRKIFGMRSKIFFGVGVGQKKLVNACFEIITWLCLDVLADRKDKATGN